MGFTGDEDSYCSFVRRTAVYFSIESVRRLAKEESGQDLVEYALLILLIVLASIAAWDAIVLAMGAAYRGYDSSLWGLFWEAPGA